MMHSSQNSKIPPLTIAPVPAIMTNQSSHFTHLKMTIGTHKKNIIAGTSGDIGGSRCG